MKPISPKLFLILLLSAQWCQAQWYSYDAFERTYLSRTQLLAMAVNQSAQPVLNKFTATATFNAVVAENKKALKDTLHNYDSMLIIRLSALNTRKNDLQKIIDTAHGAFKDSVQAVADTNHTLIDSLSSGKEKDALKKQLQAYSYMQSRYHTFSFFPVRNSRAAEAYFENSDSIVNSDSSGVFKFENAYLNYLSNTKTLAAYTEPVSDFIGPVRLSLGLMVLAPSTKDSAAQTKDQYDKKRFKDKFKSGGGNVTVNASFPLWHLKLSKYFDWKSYYSPRFSLDVPDSSGSSIKFPLHAQWLGWDNQVKITTLENKLSFLLCYRYARVSGNSTFYDRLNMTGDQRKTFNFTTWTVGFIAKNKIAVYYTWYAGSSHIINNIGNNNSITANIQLD